MKQHIRRRTAATLLAVGLLVTSLTACSSATKSGPEKLLVWLQSSGSASATDTAIKADKDLIAKFQATHPELSIKTEVYTQTQLNQNLKSALASNKGPDVFYNDVTPTREMFKAGLVADLSKYNTKFGWSKRLYPAGLAFTQLNGKTFGLGLEFEFVGVFWNEALLSKVGLTAPTDYNSTIAFCKAATKAGYVAFAHSGNPGWQHYFLFAMPLASTLGVGAERQLVIDGKGSWDQPAVVEAYQKAFVDLTAAGCFPKDVNGVTFESGTQLFTSGKALGLPTGTWAIPSIDAAGMKDVSMAPFPQLGAHPAVYTVGMGSMWGVSAKSTHIDAAAGLIDSLMSQASAKTWVNDAGFIPPMNLDQASLAVSPLKKFALTTLAKASTDVNSLGLDIDLYMPVAFNDLMSSGGQAVISGQKSAGQQAKDLNSAAK